MKAPVRTTKRPLAQGWAKLLTLWTAASLAACGSEEASTPEPTQGAALITLVAPTEAAGLDPFAAEHTLRLRRGVPGGGLEDIDVVLRDGALRAEPYAGDQPTRFVVEVQKAGAIVARAETAVAVIREDEPDRAMPALLVPPRTLVAPVDADGDALLAQVRPGASVTPLGDGRLWVAGGDVGSGGQPCAPATPEAVVASGRAIDLLGLRAEPEVTLLAGRAYHAAVPLIGGRVALLGGYGGTAGGVGLLRGVEVVTPHEGKTEGASFELARGRARAGVLQDGNVVVLVGGDEEAVGGPTATIERFDLGFGTLATASLATPRRDPAVALVNEPGSERRLLFVLGGRDAAGNAVQQGEVLELKGETYWPLATVLAPTPSATDAAWLASETPFAAARFGGTQGQTPLATALQWSPLTGQWGPANALASARSCMGLGAFDGEVWLVGGLGAGGAADATVERYSPIPAAFSMASGRVGPKVLPGPGPHLLIAGGRDAAGQPAGLGLYWPAD